MVSKTGGRTLQKGDVFQKKALARGLGAEEGSLVGWGPLAERMPIPLFPHTREGLKEKALASR